MSGVYGSGSNSGAGGSAAQGGGGVGATGGSSSGGGGGVGGGSSSPAYHQSSSHQHPSSNYPSQSQSPYNQQRPQGQGISSTMAPLGSTVDSGPQFTPEMRERQSRGKDPYEPDSGSENISFPFLGSMAKRKTKETHQKIERRNVAAAVLDSPELLMIHAQRSGDSIPATRLRFMTMMCGYDEEGDKKKGKGRPPGR